MKNSFILAVLTLSIISSCKKEVTPVSATSENSTATLNQIGFAQSRVVYHSNDLPQYEKTDNKNITFTHIADVSSPKVNGAVTSATGLEIVGNYAYVTYHIAGAQYGGALEVFDISSPSKPSLVSQLILTDTDLNECTVANGKVYAVGGRDIYSSKFSENNTKGGILLEVSLQNNLLSKDLRWAQLPSYSGNSVNAAGSYLFVTAGSTGGGVFTLNASDLKIVQSDLFDNPKFCDIRSNKIGEKMYVLQGENALVHEYTAGLENVKGKKTYTIAKGNVPSNGKAVVAVDGDNLYVCTGNNGLLAYNTTKFEAGTTLNFKLPAGKGNANGVDTDDKFIYVANGLDGVVIINKDDQSIHTVFSYTYSSNYIQEGNGYVFIANGKDGLKILKRNNPVVVVEPVKNGCGKALTDCAAATRVVMTPETSSNDYNVNGNETKILKAGTSGKNTVGKLSNNATFLYCGNFTATNGMTLNGQSYTEFLGNVTTKELLANSCSYIGGKLSVSDKLTFNGHSTSQITNGVSAGSAMLNSIVEILAGGLTTTGDVTMNSNSYLTLTGNMVVGGNYTLSSNSTLKITGDITINGDFDFKGNIIIVGSSKITVNGKVKSNPNATITGTYTSNKPLK